MTSHIFWRNSYDSCVYFKELSDGLFVYLFLYVDDILIAVSCEDFGQWMIAIQEEMESLHKNGTWDLVRLPKDKKVVHCKWVFKNKEGTSGVKDARYK